jgi:ubiquitin C-terminal hydrolase
MKYYDEKKTHQDKKFDKNIKPYLEALSIFTKIDKISKNFSKIYDERNKNNILTENFDSLESFIKYFKQNNIKEKKNFSKSPENIFNLFLDELHKLFKMNSLKEEEEKEIGKNKEIDFDKDIAHQSFNKFYKKDRSIIRDLFFGVKLIKKTCKFCGITEYNYEYLKVVPLNVEQITSEIEAEAEAEDIISSLEKSFEKEFLCQICSIKQKFDIEMKVIKEPKILIIIIKIVKKK